MERVDARSLGTADLFLGRVVCIYYFIIVLHGMMFFFFFFFHEVLLNIKCGGRGGLGLSLADYRYFETHCCAERDFVFVVVNRRFFLNRSTSGRRTCNRALR